MNGNSSDLIFEIEDCANFDISEHLALNKKIDDFFAINFSKSEQDISLSKPSHYKDEVLMDGLSTFYYDMLGIEKLLSSKSHLVDVGSGHCRLALFLAMRNKDLTITCLENQASRMQAAKKFAKVHNLSNIKFVEGDISEIKNLKADFYYFYFPVCSQLKQFLTKNVIGTNAYVIATESHGDFFNFINDELVGFEKTTSFKLVAPRHNRECQIWSMINEQQLETFNKQYDELNTLLHAKKTVEYLHTTNRFSTFILNSLNPATKVEFSNGDIVLLAELTREYFSQYQLVSLAPRRVYKFSNIRKLLL
jgi:hypothetical protein